jgi:hypothetical protein
MRSNSARSCTDTLEISTAIAGAAVVRSWRTGAVWADGGEPLKRFANSAWTKSPNLWLKPVKGACARSQGSKPLTSVEVGKSGIT